MAAFNFLDPVMERRGMNIITKVVPSVEPNVPSSTRCFTCNCKRRPGPLSKDYIRKPHRYILPCYCDGRQLRATGARSAKCRLPAQLVAPHSIAHAFTLTAFNHQRIGTHRLSPLYPRVESKVQSMETKIIEVIERMDVLPVRHVSQRRASRR